jgi:uncharacterized protein (TIGR01777 family)
MKITRVAMSGASGLIGSALAAELTAAGVDVIKLVRRPARTAGEVTWNPLAPADGLDQAALDGVTAVVHLSGAPVAGGRWTAARKAELRASRITSTQTLVTAMVAAADRSPQASPRVLLCGSAIGFYGDTGGRLVDESSAGGTGFLAELVRDWEAATAPAAAAGIRVVNLRSGLVLTPRGGILGSLMLPFKLGLGARIGPGTQYLSWISLTDEIGAIRFLLDRDDLAGPVNLTAPEAVTNAEFTRALARALRRPAVLQVPAPVLRGALGEVATELLGSVRVKPTKLLEAGFTFRDPDLGTALTAILASHPGR